MRKRGFISTLILMIPMLFIGAASSDESNFNLLAYKNSRSTGSSSVNIYATYTNVYNNGKYGASINNGDKFDLYGEDMKTKPNDGGSYTDMFVISIYSDHLVDGVDISIQTSDFILASGTGKESYKSSTQLKKEYFYYGCKDNGSLENASNTYEGGKSRNYDNIFNSPDSGSVYLKGGLVECRITASICLSSNALTEFKNYINNGARYKVEYTTVLTIAGS